MWWHACFAACRALHMLDTCSTHAHAMHARARMQPSPTNHQPPPASPPPRPQQACAHLEQRAQPRLALAAHAADHLWRAHAQERDARLASDRVRQRRLAAAGRAVQQHAARRLHTQPAVHLGGAGVRGGCSGGDAAAEAAAAGVRSLAASEERSTATPCSAAHMCNSTARIHARSAHHSCRGIASAPPAAALHTNLSAQPRHPGRQASQLRSHSFPHTPLGA